MTEQHEIESGGVAGPIGSPTPDQVGATTRAKFRCNSKVESGYGGWIIQLSPVYAPDDPKSENGKFWEATPNGHLVMQITNPAGAEVFEVGQDYYVDFTRA